MNDFIFKEESETSESLTVIKSNKKWRILIVDDDDSVHHVTRLVLSGAEIESRQLEITSVYSMEEAKETLLKDNDFCMAFVDVVMETDHAGLELVQWIREELKNQFIRLILRTGQAGTAPEAKVIKDYDINDYKEKTDFTSNKMITTVYAGIRAYRDIMTIQRSLDAFKKLLEATHDLLKKDQLKSFGSAALNHLLSLMNVDSSALYIARTQIDFDLQSSSLILACTGKYVSESDSLELSDIDNDVKEKIQQVFKSKDNYSNEHCFVGYYQSSINAASVLYIEFEDDQEHFKVNLAELFATNIALILESLTRQKEIEETQKELLFIVGEVLEARSKGKSYHVKRVALLCELLATKLGLEESFIKALGLAVTLHDFEDVGIPKYIMNKPDKLVGDEWGIMKNHAITEGDILQKSTVSVSKLASRLVYSYHENWDGSGYPEGLKGNYIPIESRIMAVVNVFDALGSTRSDTAPLTDEKIKDFIILEKNKKFDAALVDIIVDNFDEFTSIRAQFPDN